MTVASSLIPFSLAEWFTFSAFTIICAIVGSNLRMKALEAIFATGAFITGIVPFSYIYVATNETIQEITYQQGTNLSGQPGGFSFSYYVLFTISIGLLIFALGDLMIWFITDFLRGEKAK